MLGMCVSGRPRRVIQWMCLAYFQNCSLLRGGCGSPSWCVNTCTDPSFLQNKTCLSLRAYYVLGTAQKCFQTFFFLSSYNKFAGEGRLPGSGSIWCGGIDREVRQFRSPSQITVPYRLELKRSSFSKAVSSTVNCWDFPIPCSLALHLQLQLNRWGVTEIPLSGPSWDNPRSFRKAPLSSSAWLGHNCRQGAGADSLLFSLNTLSCCNLYTHKWLRTGCGF